MVMGMWASKVINKATPSMQESKVVHRKYKLNLSHLHHRSCQPSILTRSRCTTTSRRRSMRCLLICRLRFQSSPTARSARCVRSQPTCQQEISNVTSVIESSKDCASSRKCPSSKSSSRESSKSLPSLRPRRMKTTKIMKILRSPKRQQSPKLSLRRK